MKEQIEIIEVSPRDGLQNEASLISTQDKLSLISQALDSGVKRIEVASFVHPKRVPQMADAEAVCDGLPDNDQVIYVGLVLNQRGLDRAMATGKIDEIGCVAVASEGFGQANQNQSIVDSVRISNQLIRLAKTAGLRAQATISVAFGCPFDGPVKQQTVVDMAKQLVESEPDEIALADTIGVAVPTQVTDLFNAVREAIGPNIPLRAHFHNTRNTGIANAYAALNCGIERLDASIGGIGGCPFAPRATGNIPTEDLVYMLNRMGVNSGVTLSNLIQTAEWLEQPLGHEVAGMVSKAGDFPANDDAGFCQAV